VHYSSLVSSQLAAMANHADPFTRPSMFPEAQQWKEQLEAMKAARLQEEHEQQAREAAQAQLIKSWEIEVQQMKVERNEALRKAEEAEEHARRQVQDYHWATAKKLQEMEEKIRRLQSMLDEERTAQILERQRQTEQVAQVRREAAVELEEAEKRHRLELAAEQERVREAHDLVELVQKRAHEDVVAARAREERRIAEVRAAAESRARELEAKMRSEANMRDAHLLERQRLMEDALYANGREKAEAIDQAQRHLACMEQELQTSKDQADALYAEKEARLKEFQETARKNTDEVVKHHKELLDLERALHNRSMERTMDRVVHHLKLGPDEGGLPVPQITQDA